MTHIEERLVELLHAAAPSSPGVSFEGVEREVRRRRVVRWSFAASAAAFAVIVAAVSVTAMSGRDRSSEPPTASSVNLAGTVPWVAAPVPPYQAPTSSPTPPPASDARACTAADVRASLGGRNGAGGHLVYYVQFRNTSSSTCVLKGYPKVTATRPGQPQVTATRPSFFDNPASRTANMHPGQVTFLDVETDTYCREHPDGGPGTRPPYQHLDITLPGGGTIGLDETTWGFDVKCGLHLTRFFVRLPEQPAAPDPLGDLQVSLDVPQTVAAGSTLTYVARLTNPTARAISLQRCPGYVEAAAGPVKEAYALNCAPVGAIAARDTVRFEMRLRIPPQTAAGPLTLDWSLAAPLAVTGQATVTVTPAPSGAAAAASP